MFKALLMNMKDIDNVGRDLTMRNHDGDDDDVDDDGDVSLLSGRNGFLIRPHLTSQPARLPASQCLNSQPRPVLLKAVNHVCMKDYNIISLAKDIRIYSFRFFQVCCCC